MTDFAEKLVSELDYEDEEAYLTALQQAPILNPSVYVLNDTKEKIFLPPDASDFRSNKEHWALEPVRVKYIGRLCLKSFVHEQVRLTNKLYTLHWSVVQENHAKKIRITHFQRNIKEENHANQRG